MTDLEFYQKLNKLEKAVKQDIFSAISKIYSTIQNADNEIADIQNATCDLNIDIDERIADIENALCELSQQ